MIVDFDTLEATEIAADVCIIGAGAAGIACATQFFSGPLQVVVLEGGDMVARPECADLHKAEVVGLRHTGVHAARERVVGGTTTTWGGQALPFCPEDFEPRAWVRNSGWPIGIDSLRPYYERAEKVLGLDPTVGFEVRPWAARGVQEPAFDADTLQLFVTKWSPQPNFARLYRREIEQSQHLRLIYKANTVRLSLADDAGSIKSVEIKSLSGRTGKVTARHVILAGGAIETARLLLASNDVQPQGIGNRRDLVGRFFQDHTASVIGLLLPNNRPQVHDLFEPFYIRGFKYMPRIRLSAQHARKAGTLHAAIQILTRGETDEGIEAGKALARRALSGKWDKTATRLAIEAMRSPADILRASWRRAVEKRGSFPRKAPVWLECHCEQEPDPSSRVTLAPDRDALGMPRIRLDWRVTDLTRLTIRHMARLAAEQFASSGLGKVILEDWIHAESADWRRYVGDVYHQSGTARMGATPSDGVVDKNCKVFEVANLFVASSAVYPTSSFSNPTMTIIALAIRVTDRVKELLKSA